MGTVYWGPKYDDPSQRPDYYSRWEPLHKLLYGSPPTLQRDGQVEIAEFFGEKQKEELRERRRRVMAGVASKKKTT